MGPGDKEPSLKFDSIAQAGMRRAVLVARTVLCHTAAGLLASRKVLIIKQIVYFLRGSEETMLRECTTWTSNIVASNCCHCTR